MSTASKILFVIAVGLIAPARLLAQAIPADSLYLGQTPPGGIAKIFNLPMAGGMRPCERIAVSADGKEIYYGEINTYPPTVLRVKCFTYTGNKWQGPVTVFEGFMAPKFADNDSIIYLQNNSFYTYYAKRTGTGWSVPARVVNQNLRTHYFQKTNPNNYYASSYYEGSASSGDIGKLTVLNGDTLLQSLGIPLNSTLQENDFYIAPDESYMLVSKNSAGAASDMYLSFRKGNGKWTNPKKLGDAVNKPNNWEYGQFVSKDGKYLFFTAGGMSWSSYYTYWVRIDNMIDSLRRTNYAPYLNYQIPNQSSAAGKLFAYAVPDTVFIDDDGNNTLTYTASLSNGNSLPAWLSFNASTRVFTGTPPEAITLSVKVTAADSANASASCVFTITVGPAGAEDDRGEIPSRLNVFPNYPNPFNPSTTIHFSIPEAGKYRLSVYNSCGELIKVIADREYAPGEFTEHFEALGLSSGICFCRLAGARAEAVRKMAVLQ